MIVSRMQKPGILNILFFGTDQIVIQYQKIDLIQILRFKLGRDIGIELQYVLFIIGIVKKQIALQHKTGTIGVHTLGFDVHQLCLRSKTEEEYYKEGCYAYKFHCSDYGCKDIQITQDRYSANLNQRSSCKAEGL